MESHKKFYSNSISEDSPSYFKCQYVDVVKGNHQVLGKKIFQVAGKKNILTPVNEKKISQSSIKINPILDQDLDSLKLSIQQDITKGYRNTLRFQSNHYKSFFDKVDNSGFNRLTTEITSLYEMPKIIRTLKEESTSRKKYKSLSLDKNNPSQSSKKSQKSSFFEIQTQPRRKYKRIENQDEEADNLDEFEKKLKDLTFDKCKNVQELYHTRKKFSI